MLKKISLLGLVAFILTGCATQAPKTPVHTTISPDQHWVTSSTHTYHQGLGYFDAYLIADVSRPDSPKYQLKILEYQSYWRFLDSAFDAQGKRLRFTRKDNDRGEQLMFTLNRSILEQSHQGLKINTFGKRGKKLFMLPG
ncbi:MAG: hypothetical protein HOD21_04565, partial [Methylococcales bacterium]|nr:hypothetical protein [Methylococcales bacterium]